jgi:hypothetical protein
VIGGIVVLNTYTVVNASRGARSLPTDVLTGTCPSTRRCDQQARGKLERGEAAERITANHRRMIAAHTS